MGTRSTEQGITVVLATRNRAAVLSDTLEHLCETDRRGMVVECVIVDNNSGDTTSEVIESFKKRMTIRHLHEPQAGKNRALNLALNSGGFQPLVVFTDDDITPSKDWFHAIVSVSARWPQHMVFGGKITPAWPVANPPTWVHDPLIRQIAFTAHDLGAEERPYDALEQPFGPNFWLRREVLATGVQFDASVGPGTGSLGDEVMFLHFLQRSGFEIIYSPQAHVEHRIQSDALCIRTVEDRASMVGRIGPNMYGLCRAEILRRRPWQWRLERYVRLYQARLALLRAKLHLRCEKRLVRSISPRITIAYNVESLRLAALRPASRSCIRTSASEAE